MSASPGNDHVTDAARTSFIEGTVCPLCGSEAASIEGRLLYEDIWRHLREVWNVELSNATRRTLAPTEAMTLVRCRSCGLDRFEPLLPGNADFYKELMSIVPYNEERWEFGLVRPRLSSTDAVVDLGCGHGAFLRSLGRRSGRTVGLDHH